MLMLKEYTEKILNACMEVYNELGNGFLESVYQEALQKEFDLRHIPYELPCKRLIFFQYILLTLT